jgi:hypothetical protein
MTKVVRQERLVEVMIATWSSRIEVFSGLTTDISGESITTTSFSLPVHSIGVVALLPEHSIGVSSSEFRKAAVLILGCARLVETAHSFSLPVSLNSFGWGKWHLSRFSMFRTIESWPFLWVLVVFSPHIARHYEILTDFLYRVLHN